MSAVSLPSDAGAKEFRYAAKTCLSLNFGPSDVAFVPDDEPSFLPYLPEDVTSTTFSVPRAFAELMQDAVCHRAEDRFALLYNVLWRIIHGESDLISRAGDKVVAKLIEYRHSVRRDQPR